MVKIFKNIKSDFKHGENIEAYVTVIVAVVILVWNLVAPISAENAISVLLAVLAVIAYSTISDRHYLRNILVKNSATDHIVYTFPAGFAGSIEKSKEIWLTGIHHSSLMTDHYSSFESMLRSGGKLKVMVADPDGAACKMTAKRFAGNISAEQERTRTRENLKLLEQLAQIAPDRVKIKTMDYLFEYSAILINPHDTIYVQRYTFKIMGGSRKPKLVYYPSDEWYDLFRSEILSIWECGEPWPRETQNPTPV